MNETMQIDQTSSSSPAIAEDTPSSPVGPMVFTVGQGSAPVLKLVSPVEGGAPQLIKVVPAVVSSSDGPQEGRVSGGTLMVQKVEEGQQNEAIVSQRVYSIVQKPTTMTTTLSTISTLTTSSPSTTMAKCYNNGQQRVHTIGALTPTARVLPAGTAATAQKLQILSNVVVTKQSIVLNKNTLQAQRQIITTPLAQKQLNNNTQKPPITTKPQPGVILTTSQPKPVVSNSIKTLKTIPGALSRPTGTLPPQKTIKTISPQSPQSGYAPKTTGIKTLSPQMNNYNKNLQNAKMVQNQRVGIKTLTPQRSASSNNNSRVTLGPNKPNYIGKHASQAQKSQQKGLAAMKRNVGLPRGAGHSPTKYSSQKGVGNSQATFNQSLTAQILQSLPSAGTRGVSDGGYSTTKNYPLQSPPDDTSLSEDIGEEVKPDFSPNLNYLYQVVMLDHNYGAPPPAMSPPSITSLNSSNSAINGALVQSRSIDRDVISNVHNVHFGAQLAKRKPPSEAQRAHKASFNPSAALARDLVAAGPQAGDDDAASTISSEGAAPDDGDEGEETETAPEGEGDEDGITRCICDFDHDDGYMICCDVCSSWQHVDCMGLDRDHIPDKYSCVRCQPRRVDRQHARAIQQRKREEFARLGSVPVSATTPGAHQPTPAPPAGAGSGHQSDSSSDGSTESDTQQQRHSVSLNNNIPKKRSAPVTVTGRRKSEPVRRAPLAHKRQQRRESAAATATASAVASRRVAMKKREKKQVMKRKMKSRSSIDDSSQDSWPSTYPNMGTSLLQLRQWIENYEEAVTNHYSPELRARISNMRANGAQHGDKQDPKLDKDNKQAPSTAAQDVQVQKCRVGSQPLTGIKIVLAGQCLAANSPVIELRGKYMLSAQHRSGAGGSGSGGLLTRQHAQRPGPFLFFYRLPRDGTEVCVDTRTYGNDARFIRRSCRPNAELRHLIEKGTLHLYIITTSTIDKNMELTLRHESHDLAAVAAGPTTIVPCACGGTPSTCGLYTPHTHRNNGAEHPEEEKTEPVTHRKRRGRRASSPRRLSPLSSPLGSPLPSPNQPVGPVVPVKGAVVPEKPAVVDVAQTPPALSTRRASSHQTRAAAQGAVVGPVVEPKEHKEKEKEGRELRERDKEEPTPKEVKDKKKKLTREERKMEAIMKAFERLEKQEQRKQENQARQAQRRENDPPTVPMGPTTPTSGPPRLENGETERENVRTRRKKRKGRARTVSTTSQSSTRRRTRLNSTDSYITSGDESSLLSPPLPPSADPPAKTPPITSPGGPQSPPPIEECLSPVRDKLLSNSGSQTSDMSSPGQVNTAAGLLLALANGGAPQPPEPPQETDGNSSGSSSSVQSSPETRLSSACLLVAAAVGPLEPGFKFPKTKKAIMNEWLNKSPEMDEGNSSQNFDIYSSTNKSLATLVQAASLCDSPPQKSIISTGNTALNSAVNSGQNSTLNSGQNSAGNAKKRWLRQAISEECDSPRPDSPPGSQEMVGPPKKRRLARESLSSEQSFTPPTTPTMLVPPSNSLDDENFPNNDEEFYENPTNNLTSDNSPPLNDDSAPKSRQDHPYNAGGPYHQELDSDSPALKDQLQLEFTVSGPNKNLPTSMLDPRLGRDPRPVFRDSAQLLGTVEKTIRFYEENLTGPVTPSTPQSPLEASPQSQKPAPTLVSVSLPPQISPNLPQMSQISTISTQIPQISQILPQIPQISPQTSQISPQLSQISQISPQISQIPPKIPQISPKISHVIPQTSEIPQISTKISQISPQTSQISPQSPLQVQIIEEPLPLPPPPPPQSPLVAPQITPPPLAPLLTTCVAPQTKEKPQPKKEILTPAKRKLSISEYRQRKQLKIPDRGSSPTLDRCVTPDTPPLSLSPAMTSSSALIGSVGAKPRPRSRSASSSSATSSLSSDEEILIGGVTSSGGNADNVDNNGGKLNSGVEPQVTVAFNSAPTAVERQRENVERLKKAFGLALDDESKRNPLREKILSPTSPLILEAPKSVEPLQLAKRTEPKELMSPAHEVCDSNIKDIAPKEEEKMDVPKFEEIPSFIPPFNNPVYPNSNQFTSFSSVIDSSPYEGRNPSPPPSELLK